MKKEYADVILKYLDQTNKYCEGLDREGHITSEQLKSISTALSHAEKLTLAAIDVGPEETDDGT